MTLHQRAGLVGSLVQITVGRVNRDGRIAVECV
ncbi:MAG: hypothetical protein JWM76_5005 [Pseudonocardiales bacterium]|nr:hypothetical protein [Pseudonocardiales bacterium]